MAACIWAAHLLDAGQPDHAFKLKLIETADIDQASGL